MFVPSTITVSDGAYGRRYTDGNKALADWNAGKDFLNRSMTPGTYINKSDKDRYAPKASVMLRFNRDAEFVLINPSGAEVTGEGPDARTPAQISAADRAAAARFLD